MRGSQGELLTFDYMGFLNVCSTAVRCAYLQSSKLFTCDCAQCRGVDVARRLPCPACVPRDAAGLVPDASLVRKDNRWADGLPTVVRAVDEVLASADPQMTLPCTPTQRQHDMEDVAGSRPSARRAAVGGGGNIARPVVCRQLKHGFEFSQSTRWRTDDSAQPDSLRSYLPLEPPECTVVLHHALHETSDWTGRLACSRRDARTTVRRVLCGAVGV
jgi:hypothetical protein